MNGTDTLEYGYRTGRQDPDTTSLRPASEPPARNVAPSQFEGRQAEKVIKGMFTGTFNFGVTFNAPPNVASLTLTGSMSGSNASRQPAFKLVENWVDGNSRTLIWWQVTGSTPNPSNQNYLELYDPAGTCLANIGGNGCFAAGATGVSANFIGFTFRAAYMFMGYGFVSTLRSALYIGGVAICEQEYDGATDMRRIVMYGSQTGVAAHVTHNQDRGVGLYFWTQAAGDQRVALLAGGQAVWIARKSVGLANQSWALLQTSGNITRAGSGTTPRLSLVEWHAMVGDGGVAAVVDVTTVYIEGAPNYSNISGKNRALWVRKATGGGLVEFEHLFRVTATEQAALNASVAIINFTGTITEFSSGNHPRLSLIEFGALGVTAGAATVADATTVYIAGAPAAVVTGKNRSLWVVAGESEFGGIVTLSLDRGLQLANQTNQAAAAVGTLNNAPAAGDPAVWVPVVVNGVNRAMPAW